MAPDSSRCRTAHRLADLAGQVRAEPQVETPGGRAAEAETVTAAVTDPVCGMTVDPSSAPARRGTVYFCSADCAAAYDEDPSRTATVTASTALSRRTRRCPRGDRGRLS